MDVHTPQTWYDRLLTHDPMQVVVGLCQLRLEPIPHFLVEVACRASIPSAKSRWKVWDLSATKARFLLAMFNKQKWGICYIAIDAIAIYPISS